MMNIALLIGWAAIAPHLCDVPKKPKPPSPWNVSAEQLAANRKAADARRVADARRREQLAREYAEREHQRELAIIKAWGEKQESYQYNYWDRRQQNHYDVYSPRYYDDGWYDDYHPY